jgi:hypothetical protein
MELEILIVFSLKVNFGNKLMLSQIFGKLSPLGSSFLDTNRIRGDMFN